MERRRPALTTIALTVPGLLAVAVACADDSSPPALSETANEGRQIARRSGCTACHGADGEGGTGPGWASSLGTEIEFEDGTTATVDEAYLTRAIAEPDAEIRAGYMIQMPDNQLSDTEVAQVVAYILELNGGPSTEAAG